MNQTLGNRYVVWIVLLLITAVGCGPGQDSLEAINRNLALDFARGLRSLHTAGKIDRDGEEFLRSVSPEAVEPFVKAEADRGRLQELAAELLAQKTTADQETIDRITREMFALVPLGKFQKGMSF
jgi:hypothetical protein